MSSNPEPAAGATGMPEAVTPKVEIPVPTVEIRLLAAIQRQLLEVPGSRDVAVALSRTGEHALGWVAISAAAAAADRPRRGRWAMVGVGTFGAHATSVVLKRAVRRRRPDHPTVVVGVRTPSKLSFPSSHATSTTTFALLAGSVSGVPVAPALVPVMLASRLVLGVHYPSDVFAGAAVGTGCAALARAVWPSDAVQRLLPAALRDDAEGTYTTPTPEEKR